MLNEEVRSAVWYACSRGQCLVLDYFIEVDEEAVKRLLERVPLDTKVVK